AARDHGVLFAALPGDDRPDGRLAAMSTMPAAALDLLDRFFREGGPDNLANALRYAGTLLGRAIAWQPPVVVGPITVLGEVRDARPVALVVFYRANLLAADYEPVTALMSALDRAGLSSLAVAVSSLKDKAIELELIRLIETHWPAVILNSTAFSAMREDNTTVLDAADVPVLQVVLSGSARDARLLTRAISFKAEAEVDPRLEFASVRHRPEPDRVDCVARLTAAWARLGRKPCQERKIALVLSDYPARGGRAGYAVGLDTTESALEILRLMKAEGYDTGARDWQAADIAPLLDRSQPYLRCGNVIVLLQ